MGVGSTPGEEAHHIVPSTHGRQSAREACKILNRLGIDINAADNGVLLPKSIHDGLANDYTYMDTVFQELTNATTRSEAIEILEEIGQKLLAGQFPRAGW